MSIELVMPSNHLILCHPLLLLLSIFPSIRVFSSQSVLRIRWPKYWSFSFSISPSNEYSGLISFRMDWLGLLAVQRTLTSLLQHHSSKVSVLWCSVSHLILILLLPPGLGPSGLTAQAGTQQNYRQVPKAEDITSRHVSRRENNTDLGLCSAFLKGNNMKAPKSL